MRELRFRAWIEKENYMISHCEMMNYFEDMRGLDRNYDLFNDRDLIMQMYTGFHDVNGTEIYEGDIVNAGYDNLSVYVDGKPRVVHMGFGYDSDGWAHGSWYGWKCGESSLADVRKECSVIGNIHENKELLEEK